MIWEQAVAENAWRLEDGLYRILLPLPLAVPFVNVYLVASQSEYLLVDCGMDWLPSLRALGRALKAIGVPPRGLTTLLLTHRHPDHDGAAASVQERWGGQVLVHPRERQERSAPPVDAAAWLRENGVDEAVIARATAPSRERPRAQPPPLADLSVDEPLRVGELSFEVIPAFGHSPGQVMLREPRRGWLLTADHVIQVHGVNVWAFPGDDGDPFGEYLDSLARTAGLDARLVLPSHGIPWRGDVRDATRDLLDFHRQFADQIEQLLLDQRRTAWELARALGREIPADPIGIRFSLAEVLAALTYLAKQGKVRRAPDGRWERASEVGGFMAPMMDAEPLSGEAHPSCTA